MQNRCTNHLMADHQVILQALEVLREITARVEKGDLVDRDDVDAVLEFFNDFAHGYHDAKEQIILIPALVRAGASLNEGPVRQIMDDHRDTHSEIAQLKNAIAENRDSDFVTFAERYINTLSTHIFNEDRFLFAAISTSLTPEADKEIVEAFDGFASSARARSRQNFEAVIRKLDRKYEATVG
jgi:hemerythrin-like domain-containing protein